jgi:hypothetical protein
MPEVTQGALQLLAVVPLAVLAERFRHFTDEASQVVGPQPLGLVRAALATWPKELARMSCKAVDNRTVGLPGSPAGSLYSSG